MKVLVLYDSKTGNTEKMAAAIAEGIMEAGNEVDIKRIGQSFTPTIIQLYDGVVFGSPAIYAGPTNEMKGFLAGLKEHIGSQKPTGAKAGVFGSYGYDGAWSLENRLKGFAEALGYEVFAEACLKVDSEIKTRIEETMAECKAWGKRFGIFLTS